MSETSNLTNRQLLVEYRQLANADLNDHVDCSLSTLASRNKRLGLLEAEIGRRGLKLPEVKEIDFEKQCRQLRANLSEFQKSLKGME